MCIRDRFDAEGVHHAGVVVKEPDNLDGGEDFFVGPAVLPEAIDCFLVDAVLAAGYLHSEVQQGACLVVELGLPVVLFDLLDQRIVAGESTEILPVGFGSIEAVQFA